MTTKYESDRAPKNLDRFTGINIPPLPQPNKPIEVLSPPSPNTYPWLAIYNQLQAEASKIGLSHDVQLRIDTKPPTTSNADFSLPCHALAKPLRKPPQQIAEQIAQATSWDDIPALSGNPHAEKGFLNFNLDTERLGNQVLQQIEALGEHYGEQNIGEGRAIVIDCSSPNIAKFMSIGHLRSTIIGESLARIYRSGGFAVIRDNHLGDWGTQFGMLGRAYELWGTTIPELQDGSNIVKGLYKLYVKMHEEIEKEKSETTGESSLEREGKQWFQRLEAGDPKAKELWQWAKDLSLKEFMHVYDLLGVDFEYLLGESYYVPMLGETIEAFKKRGLADEEQGAVGVNLGDRRLVIQKSDGTSVYATRDLATIIARTAWFNPASILYVVGGEQQDYFRQIFSAFDKLTGGEGPELKHAWFGLISLPEGKMSTRKGRVIFLEDVLQEAIKRAKERLLQSKIISNDDRQIDEIARQVGVGAVIFFDLGQSRERSIQFDWDTALSLEGTSAPYIQYTHARAQSILRKAEAAGIAIDPLLESSFVSPSEQALIKDLARFPEVIQKAIKDNQPCIIAAYVCSVAEQYNHFYKQIPVLGQADEKRRNDLLRLTAAAAQVIRNGLNLLVIETPERM